MNFELSERRCLLVVRIFFLIALAVTATRASATSISFAPHPAFLLQAGHFVAQDSLDSFTHYDSAGKVVARFAPFDVRQATSTSDEKLIVLSNYSGSVAVGDLQTGQILWSKTIDSSSLIFLTTPSLSEDGSACVVCDGNGQATVLDVHTGKLLGGVRLPSANSWISCAALAPNGASGVLLKDDNHFYMFDVKSGAMTDTGILGVGPPVYSADGRYFAVISADSHPQLRVVNTSTLKWKDIGDFNNISEIRASADGTFRVTADLGSTSDLKANVAFVCTPDSPTLQQIWQSTTFDNNEYRKLDFDPLTMTGITTDFRLVTHLIDLRESKAVLTVDNSASYSATVEAARNRNRWQNPIGFFLMLLIALGSIALILSVTKRQIHSWLRRPAQNS